MEHKSRTNTRRRRRRKERGVRAQLQERMGRASDKAEQLNMGGARLLVL